MAAAPTHLPQSDPLDCEASVNAHVEEQLSTSYLYLAMAVFCHRPEVALKHFSSFFLRYFDCWAELTQQLMATQTQRGGRVILGDMEQPETSEWRGGLHAMECVFHLEKSVNQGLLELHQLAASKRDPHLASFLQYHYLRP
ncbi:ferritin heavy chain-like [Octodon degus]|uniref:Ferritin n=1 Tax=Octodon degus TaxID=10160 RepID=A0A6P3V878_OCTDE|nr:ferritin heavy chain-like [Octodon degus]